MSKVPGDKDFSNCQEFIAFAFTVHFSYQLRHIILVAYLSLAAHGEEAQRTWQ